MDWLSHSWMLFLLLYVWCVLHFTFSLASELSILLFRNYAWDICCAGEKNNSVRKEKFVPFQSWRQIAKLFEKIFYSNCDITAECQHNRLLNLYKQIGIWSVSAWICFSEAFKVINCFISMTSYLQESPEGQKMLEFRRSLPSYKERDTLLHVISQNQVRVHFLLLKERDTFTALSPPGIFMIISF